MFADTQHFSLLNQLNCEWCPFNVGFIVGQQTCLKIWQLSFCVLLLQKDGNKRGQHIQSSIKNIYVVLHKCCSKCSIYNLLITPYEKAPDNFSTGCWGINTCTHQVWVINLACVLESCRNPGSIACWARPEPRRFPQSQLNAGLIFGEGLFHTRAALVWLCSTWHSSSPLQRFAFSLQGKRRREWKRESAAEIERERDRWRDSGMTVCYEPMMSVHQMHNV